jgi:hypothetical protein
MLAMTRTQKQQPKNGSTDHLPIIAEVNFRTQQAKKNKKKLSITY